MTQIVLAFTFFVIALTLLAIALTVLRLIPSRTPPHGPVEKHIVSRWLPMLGAILRATGKFLQEASRRQIRDRKAEKLNSDQDNYDAE
jgi:hypothetical protein